MTLADGLTLVNRENWKLLPWAIALVLVGAALPAHGECVSPSAAAGATTTTVYRCSEEGISPRPQPTIVDPGKSTVVERGSADVPWFGPKPTRTADPLAAPKAASQPNSPEDVAKTEPVAPEIPPAAIQTEPPEPPATKAPDATAETPAIDKAPKVTSEDPATSTAAEAEPSDTEVSGPETTSAEPQPVKAKAAKHAKAKHKKPKLAKSKRAKAKVVEEKRGKSKATKAETEAAATGKTAKAKREPKTEQVATEPAKDDDKIILMTRKNQPLGSRIKNWLGL